jgi:uncharacterized protein YecE (DUF72 family)
VERRVSVHVGTSGWSYKEWKGSFYPADMKNDRMLSYYAERFDSVEVNNTFYRLPKREVMEGWVEQVPAGFSFAVKASQRITHRAKLGADAADALDYMLETCGALGDRLGPVLFQTPPWLKRDLPLLRDFLARIPSGTRAAFEFRSTTWFEDGVYDALAAKEAALVLADTGDEERDPPLVRTSGWGYARLRRVDYPASLLEEWAERLAGVGWEDLWVFFKHEEEGTGPALGTRFRSLMEA